MIAKPALLKRLEKLEDTIKTINPGGEIFVSEQIEELKKEINKTVRVVRTLDEALIAKENTIWFETI